MPLPLVICANLLPIGTYFCVLGLLHAAGRPLVTTAVRDFVALAVALSGLAVNGPLYVLQLRLLPDSFAQSHWAALALYILLVTALAPAACETLVVYNASPASVAAAVRTVLQRMPGGFQEIPGGWLLRGVRLELDSFPALNNVLLHFRGTKDTALYRQVQGELGELLSETRSSWSLVGVMMAAAGGLILALPIWVLARGPQDIATLFRQVLETW